VSDESTHFSLSLYPRALSPPLYRAHHTPPTHLTTHNTNELFFRHHFFLLFFFPLLFLPVDLQFSPHGTPPRTDTTHWSLSRELAPRTDEEAKANLFFQ
jgi:hypothetical protein